MNSAAIERLSSYCQALRNSELRTLQLLGCPMTVKESSQFLFLEVFVQANVDAEILQEDRISCKLIFKCPKLYPRDTPVLHIRAKRNFPKYLKTVIFLECERIRPLFRCSEHILPMVTSALHMIEREEKRGIEATDFTAESRVL